MTRFVDRYPCQRTFRMVGALALALALTLPGASPAVASPVPVKGACNPASGTAPRGEACVYLFYDAATDRVAAQGAVNPRAGHVWRVVRVEITSCTGLVPYCTTPVSKGPWPYTTRYMKVGTGSWPGMCGKFWATMTYEVDYDHAHPFTVSTPTRDSPYVFDLGPCPGRG
jgi:hypothetical protein